MWRTVAISVLSFPASILAFIIGWSARDLRTGVMVGAIIFSVFFLVSIVSLFFIKSYSYLDAFLPLVFAIVWSFILIPFTFGASAFSAPALIGSAILLGICMVLAKYHGASRVLLIFPAIVFIYEMLPVNIPGPFDDMFAFGGSVVSTFLLALKVNLKKKLKEAVKQQNGKDILQGGLQ